MTVRILTNQTKREFPYWLERTSLLPGWRREMERAAGQLRSGWSWRDLYWGWKLFRESRNYDAVVTGSEHASLVFCFLQRLRRKRKAHIIIHANWNLPASPFWRWLRLGSISVFSAAVSRILVYSSRQQERFAATFRICQSQLAVIPYHTTTYDAQFRVGAGDYIFAGGDYTRDYTTLVEACRTLRQRVIIAARDKSCFSRMTLPSHIEVRTVSHSEFFNLMGGAKVLVLPLRGGLVHSGGQQTFLNAMAMGKPVIVLDDCGADEYIVDGVSGFVLQPGDVEGLRRRLMDLENDTELARRIGQGAHAAAQGFSPEVFCHRVIALTEECIRTEGMR